MRDFRKIHKSMYFQWDLYRVCYSKSFENRAILSDFPENLEMDRYTAPSASDVSVATRLLVPRILSYGHKKTIPGPQMLPRHEEVSALRIL